jgi:hypothetical protein
LLFDCLATVVTAEYTFAILPYGDCAELLITSRIWHRC